MEILEISGIYLGIYLFLEYFYFLEIYFPRTLGISVLVGIDNVNECTGVLQLFICFYIFFYWVNFRVLRIVEKSRFTIQLLSQTTPLKLLVFSFWGFLADRGLSVCVSVMFRDVCVPMRAAQCTQSYLHPAQNLTAPKFGSCPPTFFFL